MSDGNFLQSQPFYDFADFRLNIPEKTLLHRGKPQNLPPKVFDTLCLFVENAGRLLEKEELLNTLWQNQFVEENNLAYNIKVLRKALGDSAGNPVFIETIPRRGYRFIADVKKVWPEPPSESFEELSIQPAAENKLITRTQAPAKNKRNLLPFISLVLFLAALTIIIVFWYRPVKSVEAGSSILSTPFSSDKLSTSGQVGQTVISPDGRNLFYTNTVDGKQSIWVRQLDSDNNVQFIPPSEEMFLGLAVSPDGKLLYFARGTTNSDKQLSIYRVPVIGGIPEKIIDEAQGWISFSPDGRKISFVRCYYRQDDCCSLWIADAADGAEQKQLFTQPKPFRITDNKFSPDGKTLVFATGQSETSANDFGLAAVDLESHTISEIKTRKFFYINHFAWLPDGAGFLMTARGNTDENFGIWQVTDGSDEARLLTRDAESYSNLSLDAAATKLISTEVSRDYHLVLYSLKAPTEKHILTDATTASFIDDGTLIFSSAMTGGNTQLWQINVNGSDQHQLTNQKNNNLFPISSPDKEFIFFTSNQTGEQQIWRMNGDGSNKIQITHRMGGFPIIVSPDGKWLYYASALEKTLWRIAAAGGEETLVLDQRKLHFAMSADCSKAAFFDIQDGEKTLTIFSLLDGRAIRTFKVPDQKIVPEILLWSSDGEKIFYALTDKAQNSAIWMQAAQGGEPHQVIDLKGDAISSLALSPDGKNLAVVEGKWKHDAVLLKGLK